MPSNNAHFTNKIREFINIAQTEIADKNPEFLIRLETLKSLLEDQGKCLAYLISTIYCDEPARDVREQRQNLYNILKNIDNELSNILKYDINICSLQTVNNMMQEYYLENAQTINIYLPHNVPHSFNNFLSEDTNTILAGDI